MTMPLAYARASEEFEAFMADFMAFADLPTHHRAYHSIRAVLHVFRAHLNVADALAFAGVLPPVVRAIFVEDWRPEATPRPFADRDALFGEIKAVRRDHNQAPVTVIADAARALRRHVDNAALDRVLQTLPPAARDFWAAA